MTDPEKVTEGLKGLRSHFHVLSGITSSKQNRVGYIESARIIDDALALLKAQEPRLMTLEEILSSDGAVWILDRDDKECEIHIAFPLRKRGELDPVIEFRSREPDMLEHRLIRDYLIGWCCWTSRPTDAQREATPWN